jgi:hypothetical protein
MKALLPFSTQPPSRGSARVCRAAASEPEPGSVRPQAPSTSPPASRGSQRRFCSVEAKSAMWFVHSELWPHIVMPTEASPRLSSSTISA